MRGTATPTVSASADLAGPALDGALGQLEHAARVDGALERAAEGGADRERRADPVRLRTREDAHASRDGLLERGVGVALVELLAGREGEVHLLEADVAQALVAALVDDETGVDHALDALDAGDDLLGARHLRHVLRVHEAGGLDAAEPCAGEPVDQLGADRGRERERLVLEAVPRGDVADRDHTTPSSCSPSSSELERPSSPQ